MKRVYIADTLVDGQLVLDLLQEAGITARLFNQNAQGGLGELPVSPPEVWILRNRDEAQAGKLVRSFKDRRIPRHSLPCMTCGEHNPESFEICWQCHQAL
jgi:hypothetical protein